MKQIIRIIPALFLMACSVTPEQAGVAPVASCQVIYDAGSSGTRLYIYQQAMSGWVKHSGPGMPALADPVRGNRNKTMAHANALTDAIVAGLDDIRQPGPMDKNGSPGWQAFDWHTECRLAKVAVYATAGMRLAEKENPAAAGLLWEMLNRKLRSALDMPVTTRTLTGFEEGLFAWLATREQQADGHFGIAEMGGASAQLSFPCTACDASRRVMVQGVEESMVSVSFLGMGLAEVWNDRADHARCKFGVGLKNPDWRTTDCTDAIEIPAGVSLRVRADLEQADIQRWYLAGAFAYSEHTDIENYCLHNVDGSYKPETACFRAVYQPYFLDLLGVPVSSELSDAGWTLGAAICTHSDCLAKAGPPECQWSVNGCMK